jgi:3-oxoacyl-[acyl-carrier protein] reductase
MELGLDDRAALVTGASAGLGLAAARALAADGARVLLVSRSAARLQQAATTIHAATGRHVDWLAGDVAELDAIPDLAAAARDRLGPIEILVANAGGPPAGRFEELPRGEFERAFRLTLMSAVELCRAVLPDMKTRRRGRIVAITSTSVKQPIDGLLLSNVFRAGLTAFLKTLSREVGGDGITVNSVAPGYTETERLAELGERNAALQGKSIDEIYAGWAAATALGRLGEPDEIGAAVAWLCSDRAAFITGQVLAVDGGRTTGLL